MRLLRMSRTEKQENGMKAKAIENTIQITTSETLPDGVKVAITDCADYQAFKKLPKAIELNGVAYALTGWNSDRFCAYYRNDRMDTIATVLKRESFHNDGSLPISKRERGIVVCQNRSTFSK